MDKCVCTYKQLSQIVPFIFITQNSVEWGLFSHVCPLKVPCLSFGIVLVYALRACVHINKSALKRSFAPATHAHVYLHKNGNVWHASVAPIILFIVWRRRLILLVRLNEYLIGSEIEKGTTATTHCQIVICYLDMRVSVFALFLWVDDGFLRMDYCFAGYYIHHFVHSRAHLHCKYYCPFFSLALGFSLSVPLAIHITINIVADTSESMQNCVIHKWTLGRTSAYPQLITSYSIRSVELCSHANFYAPIEKLCLFIYFHRLFFLSHTIILSFSFSLHLPFRLELNRLWIGYITLYHLFIADVDFFLLLT